MRSQNEILTKITQITKMFKSKRDPIYLQYRILIHKLTWENAKQFIKLEKRTEKFRLKWEDTSHMEKKFILKEISEQVDAGAMCVQSKDAIESLSCALIILTQVWFLGSIKDKALKLFWQEFNRPISPHIFYENVFASICEEFGLPWEDFKLRYSPLIM